jgi:hypothetical protein
MFSKRVLIAAAMIGALSACNTAPIGSEDLALGESVKYDAAIQTINPAPVYTAESAQPGANGDKGAAAVKRYRTDQVKALETMETTQSMSGSSNGSNSSSTPH